MSVVTRSRVTPAVGSTMAMRRPASQLKTEDFPTLGRPTMATTGTGTSSVSGRWGSSALLAEALLYSNAKLVKKHHNGETFCRRRRFKGEITTTDHTDNTDEPNRRRRLLSVGSV